MEILLGLLIVVMLGWFYLYVEKSRKKEKEYRDTILLLQNEKRGISQDTREGAFAAAESIVPESNAVQPYIRPGVAPSSSVSPVPAMAFTRIWDNWYKDNSVNLLLYTGAFLILSAASIYVAYSWNELSGFAKFFTLGFVTVSFFISGFYLLKNTTRFLSAGYTFIGVGALMLPLNGVSLQNFVVSPMTGNTSDIWIGTSVICLWIYLSLAYYLKSRFYSYITSLGALSLVESFVHVTNGSFSFYILGGILNSLLLLTMVLFTKRIRKEDFFNYPLYVSSQIILPVSLAFGLLAAIQYNSLLTGKVALALALSGIFYGLLYCFEKRSVYYFALFSGFLTAALLLCFHRLGVNGYWMSFLIIVVAGIFLSTLYKNGYIYRKFFNSQSVRKEEYIVLLIDTVILTCLAIVAGISSDNYITIFMCAVVFFLLYSFTAIRAYFSLSLLLLPFVCLEIASTYHFNASSTILAIQTGGIVTILISYYYFSRKYRFETITACIISLGISIFSTAVYILAGFEIQILLCGVIILALESFLGYYFTRIPLILYIASAAWSISAYIAYSSVFFTKFPLSWLAWFYLGMSVLYYLLACRVWRYGSRGTGKYLLSICTGNFLLAFILSISSPYIACCIALGGGALALLASYTFNENRLIYLSNAFLYVAYGFLLGTFSLRLDFYPLFFMLLSVVVYSLGFMHTVNADYKIIERKSILIALPVIIFIYTAIYSFIGCGASVCIGGSYSVFEASLIAMSMLTACIYYEEGRLTQIYHFKYVASGMLILSILWLMQFFEVDTMEPYTLLTGVYLVAVSQISSYYDNYRKLQRPMETAGLCFIVLFTLIQSVISGNSILYTGILASLGIGLFFYGVSSQLRRFTYWGTGSIAAAVFSQSYAYIFNLPEWIYVALIGAIFIGIALYLPAKKTK